jgi:hypothetical protein
MKPHLMRMLKDERGQILPWMVFLSVLVIGVAGLTIDLGHAYVCYRELQASTDAAALAGAYAMTLSGATQASVTSSVNAYASVKNGANANGNLPSPTISTTFRCVTDSAMVAAPCSASATGYNVIEVVQKSAVPTFFIRALAAMGVNSAQSIGLSTTATATPMSGKNTQVNVAMVVDTTASMGSNDSDPNCNNTRIHCALAGVQTMLGALSPCTASSTKAKCTPYDQVSLFTFPTVQANTASNDTNCSGKNPTVVPYSTPAIGATWTAPTGTAATYQITDYLSDYSSTNQQGGSLNTSSSLTSATSTSGKCPGMQTPGGDGTYYAGAIYAAQSSLSAAQLANPGSVNYMVILSDGDANADSSKITGSNKLSGNVYGSANDECHQAIDAANYATNNGTTVITVGYGAANSGCSTDTGSFKISPCATIQQMSSGYTKGDTSHFYSDTTAAQNKGQCPSPNTGSLDSIFTSIAAQFSQSRLVPNGTT